MILTAQLKVVTLIVQLKRITMKIINSTLGRIAMIIIAVFTISAFATRESVKVNPSNDNAMMIADWKWA